MNLDFRPSLEDVFEHYGARILNGSGEWRKAECPLTIHDDKNPSASVNTEQGKWTCFSCDMHGDGLDIIKENEGIVGFHELVAFAEENFAGGGGEVRGERERGGLLPRPTGHKPGGRNWSPPWKSV